MRNILVLATVTLGTLSLNAQNTTMFVHTTDGNVTSTDIAKVDKITFTDAEYNLNDDKDRILEYNELNWPEYRLEAIERHMQKRVQQLLELKGI